MSMNEPSQDMNGSEKARKRSAALLLKEGEAQ
jgi:hypothetical protein